MKVTIEPPIPQRDVTIELKEREAEILMRILGTQSISLNRQHCCGMKPQPNDHELAQFENLYSKLNKALSCNP